MEAVKLLDDDGLWKTIPCKLWEGYVTPEGYGQLRVDNKIWAAHRRAYFLEVGPLIEGLQICHRCNVKICYEPAHLYQGTLQENQDHARRSGAKAMKLDANTVLAIRARVAEGITYRAAAVEFGIHFSTVAKICLRYTWTHI